jgi:hypothetical protein
MDAQSAALVESLRAGASRLAEDLTAVETNMAELYDAAAGRAGENVSGEPSPAASSMPVEDPAPASGPGADAPVRQGHSEFVPAAAPPVSPVASTPPVPVPTAAAPAAPPVPPPAPSPPPTPPRSEPRANTGNGDLDGARLIALNMALNGDSRAATDKYLAEHYELGDRQKLLDEVYAAIEG